MRYSDAIKNFNMVAIVMCIFSVFSLKLFPTLLIPVFCIDDILDLHSTAKHKISNCFDTMSEMFHNSNKIKSILEIYGSICFIIWILCMCFRKSKIIYK